MARKRLELIGPRQLHLAESVQNPLESRKDAARFTTVSRIGGKDQGPGCSRMDQQKRTRQTEGTPDLS
jgi:hypothetical protein